MAEYGDYKKEIKTLGDLRTFVNETLKDIDDNYTFDIDDDFMGVDIILLANCDVSYSEQSFYWSAKVNYATDTVKVINDRTREIKKIKAFEIIKEKKVNIGTFYHVVFILKAGYEDCLLNNNTTAFNICDTRKEFLTKEEFSLLKEVLYND